MEILSSSQIKKCDAYSMACQGISSLELMERAAVQCFHWIRQRFSNAQDYVVICGNGNNGGDGLVIARHLIESGARCSVWICEFTAPSQEFQINLQRLLDAGVKVQNIFQEDIRESCSENVVLIDAILGSGIRHPLEGKLTEVFTLLNQMPKHALISIDIPSGFHPDLPMPEDAVALEADFTLCFHRPRLMFFFSESERYTGQWEILDIGLQEPEEISSPFCYQLKHELTPIVEKRKNFCHKGSFGHVFIAGGSEGHCGSITMTTKACLRSGAGLVTTLLPQACLIPFQANCMEAMTLHSDAETHLRYSSLKADKFKVIAFGPGAGMHEDTARLLKLLIQESRGPMVIDADGLNILAENKTWLSFIPPFSILTPHPAEFDRIAGKSHDSYQRFEKAIDFSAKHRLILVLKDAYTRVILPDGRVFFNSTGNPGMATAGSGDVLTGIVAGILAQGVTPEGAARVAVFLHGLAGDFAAEMHSEPGMIAGDIVHFLPEAWKAFQS